MTHEQLERKRLLAEAIYKKLCRKVYKSNLPKDQKLQRLAAYKDKLDEFKKTVKQHYNCDNCVNLSSKEFWRELTPYEANTNFVYLAEAFDTAEVSIVEELAPILNEQIDRIVEKANSAQEARSFSALDALKIVGLVKIRKTGS